MNASKSPRRSITTGAGKAGPRKRSARRPPAFAASPDRASLPVQYPANIQALVEAGSDNAAPVLRHLIAYLRAAMPHLADADATLGNEMQLVSSYLEIMHMRMPDRLQFKLDLAPELMDLRFPAMALLTLVENAVRHGIDPSTEGGSIEVGGRLNASDMQVCLWVADTGVGMAETAQPGTGLKNVRTRLQAVYGSNARLDLHEQAERGLRVELIFNPGSKGMSQL